MSYYKKRPVRLAWTGFLIAITLLLGVGYETAWSQSNRPAIQVQPLDDPDAGPADNPGPQTPSNLVTKPAIGPPVVDKTVILQALDKLTARVFKIEVEIGRPTRFGTLDIIAHTCNKRPPEESPETTAFLEITEVREGEEPATLFIGWMFASSPALSALEHPVYDVWVLDCQTKDG